MRVDKLVARSRLSILGSSTLGMGFREVTPVFTSNSAMVSTTASWSRGSEMTCETLRYMIWCSPALSVRVPEKTRATEPFCHVRSYSEKARRGPPLLPDPTLFPRQWPIMDRHHKLITLQVRSGVTVANQPRKIIRSLPIRYSVRALDHVRRSKLHHHIPLDSTRDALPPLPLTLLPLQIDTPDTLGVGICRNNRLEGCSGYHQALQPSIGVFQAISTGASSLLQRPADGESLGPIAEGMATPLDAAFAEKVPRLY
jgi:hypothetical protein